MKPIAVIIILFFTGFHCFAQTTDTLVTKRVFVTTVIYRNGFKLPHKRVKSLFKDTWQPRVKYNWGTLVAPVGTAITAAGLGLTVIALKGTPATTFAEGRDVNYTVRSLPKVLMGIGIVTVGVCLIEASNEWVQSSVNIYNARQNNLRARTSVIQKINLGFTDSNGLGLSMRF
ncbi:MULTISPECIES: hypothetical protein [Emticicia]|uniref:hypothetical protein n=1 Tax=Emticicia TaxID=312278 RepID=UPI0020A08C80|nr:MULTISPECIES: hypothetical protein [Emticicia]UTA69593.1 hypothetical protein MB380_07215 [Emticicia sp. 21SJ11W-3]